MFQSLSYIQGQSREMATKYSRKVMSYPNKIDFNMSSSQKRSNISYRLILVRIHSLNGGHCDHRMIFHLCWDQHKLWQVPLRHDEQLPKIMLWQNRKTKKIESKSLMRPQKTKEIEKDAFHVSCWFVRRVLQGGSCRNDFCRVLP